MTDREHSSLIPSGDPEAGSVDYWRDKAFECLATLNQANDTAERFADVLDELRGAYDDYYSSDGPERLTRLLNAEKLVRDVRYG